MPCVFRQCIRLLAAVTERYGERWDHGPTFTQTLSLDAGSTQPPSVDGTVVPANIVWLAPFACGCADGIIF